MQIVVVGLGYVGLPLAVALAKHFDTVGLDVDEKRISELDTGYDRTAEIDEPRLKASSLTYLSDSAACPPADVYIITVPTPIDADRKPDLGAVKNATRTVAGMIDKHRHPIIVYESTVYPGVTEDICGPLIEEVAGLSRGEDFFLGYSPERINPGDREHTVERITKVIAGESPGVTEKLAEMYGKVTSGGVFRAKSIRAAEAAKVIENAQRDVNIAFMNELAQIFAHMDISIWDVLDAARTKWNFLPFQPGLVGGHCIGVDPYYLSYRAQELGYDPNVILAGRALNDGMAGWLAGEIHKARKSTAGSILLLGLTFKENVPDIRNSKVVDLVKALEHLGHHVTVHDPLADPKETLKEYSINLENEALSGRYDCVIGAVSHESYRSLSSGDLADLLLPGGSVVDLKRIWNAENLLSERLEFWSL
ncbi:nucleotide sugar dehydrogenase [Novosphingopyxis sp.]|uniref:nucleotide sugar dehydrogenase n=1 Tax=Novosphingopyxis sp. TaxID=2709690 RepID=UPI003B591B91